MNDWLEYTDTNRYLIHLGELLKLFLHKIWIIILSVMLLGGIFFAYSSYCISPLYQSSIKLYVNNSANTSDSTSITSSDITASQNLVDTYAVVLTSYPTLSAVIEQTGVSYSYEELYSMISTAAIDETEVFKVTVTSTDAYEAEKIANAIAEIAPDEIMDIVSGSSVKVVEYARVATKASYPNITKYALLGGVAGLALSCLGIMLFSMLGNGMSVEDKIRRDFKNREILSVIPLMGSKGKGKKRSKPFSDAELCEKLSFAAAESYKLLRENITFYFPDDKSYKVIGITSSIRAEGKTTTAINLAYTLAQANKKVCLIDCDFRLPSIAKRLKMHKKPGMTNFLIGQSDGANILQIYSIDETMFYVITSGDIPPNPSELLGSAKMRDTIKVIGGSFDYMILDLPPIGVVSDAMAATKLLDGMLMIVREDFYERKLLQESLRTLEAVETKILGFVVTQSTTQEKEYKKYSSKYSYKYEYKYGYGYGYADVQGESKKDAGRHEIKK